MGRFFRAMQGPPWSRVGLMGRAKQQPMLMHQLSLGFGVSLIHSSSTAKTVSQSSSSALLWSHIAFKYTTWNRRAPWVRGVVGPSMKFTDTNRAPQRLTTGCVDCSTGSSGGACGSFATTAPEKKTRRPSVATSRHTGHRPQNLSGKRFAGGRQLAHAQR